MTTLDLMWWLIVLGGSFTITLLGYFFLGELIIPKVKDVERQAKELRSWWHQSRRMRLPKWQDHFLLVFEYSERRVRRFYLQTLFLSVATSTTSIVLKIDLIFSIVYVICLSVLPYVVGLQGLVKRRYQYQQDFREFLRVVTSRYMSARDIKLGLLQAEKMLGGSLKAVVRRLNTGLVKGRRAVTELAAERFYKEVGSKHAQIFRDLLLEASLSGADMSQGMADLYHQMATIAEIDQDHASENWEFRLYVYLIPFLFIIVNTIVIAATKGGALALYLHHPVIAPLAALSFFFCVTMSLFTMFYFMRGG